MSALIPGIQVGTKFVGTAAPASDGGGTTAGVLDVIVTNEMTVDFDGANFTANLSLSTTDENGAPVGQGISFFNAGGGASTTAYKIDVGGAATKASIAGKIKDAVELGLGAAALVTAEIVETNVADDTCRITSLGLGAARSIFGVTFSDGLDLDYTEGT